MCQSTTIDKYNDDPSTIDDDPSKISPPSVRGFPRNKHWVSIALGMFLMTYGIVHYNNPHFELKDASYCSATTIIENEEQQVCKPARMTKVTNFLSKRTRGLIPAKETSCQEVTPPVCLRPDLVAYKVTTLLAMTLISTMGFINWHFRLPHKTSRAERLFGYLPAADLQNSVSLGFQIFDIGMSLTIPEQGTVIFIVHHILALCCAYYSLEYQMVPYYSIFYGGCSEVSSVFLIFLTSEGMFVLPESMNVWIMVCKGLFFVTFSYYRIVGWIYYSFPLWRDCNTSIRSGEAEKYRPGRAWGLRLFQGFDFTLGLLQCYWYSIILQQLIQVLT